MYKLGLAKNALDLLHVGSAYGACSERWATAFASTAVSARQKRHDGLSAQADYTLSLGCLQAFLRAAVVVPTRHAV